MHTFLVLSSDVFYLLITKHYDVFKRQGWYHSKHIQFVVTCTATFDFFLFWIYLFWFLSSQKSSLLIDKKKHKNKIRTKFLTWIWLKTKHTRLLTTYRIQSFTIDEFLYSDSHKQIPKWKINCWWTKDATNQNSMLFVQYPPFELSKHYVFIVQVTYCRWLFHTHTALIYT